jgi:hypothetical protein
VTPEQIQGWLQIGLGGIMLAALFMGYRRIWVFGWLYTEAVKDRDEWKALALGRLTSDADVASSARRFVLSSETAEEGARVVREAGKQ